MNALVKIIGTSGQISLGKEYAGRQVLIEVPEPGVWLVRTASVVPDNERWLHTPQAKDALGAAIAWATNNPPIASDLSTLKKLLKNGVNKSAGTAKPAAARRARSK
ncbi:MAG: hypothetical protein ACKVQK_01750 [Burkholderiales bacterium]